MGCADSFVGGVTGGERVRFGSASKRASGVFCCRARVGRALRLMPMILISESRPPGSGSVTAFGSLYVAYR